MAAELFNQSSSGRKNAAAAAAMDGSGLLPTYSYASFGNTPAATATNILTLAGAAGKIIKIRSVFISGIATTAGSLRTDLVKRSTADSGGTATTPTGVAWDSQNPTAAATLALYTANPTVGTAVGILATRRVFLNLTTAVIDRMVESFGIRWESPIVIRESEYFSISHAGATIPSGGVVDLGITWTEE